MIDMQDHIRNRSALNLFDGKSFPRGRNVTGYEPMVTHRKVLIPIEPVYYHGKLVVERQTVVGTLVTETAR